MKPIIVIGGLNMDVLGVPAGTFEPGDSLPGRIQLRPGGVGRNIAAALRLLGADVELLTALGDDAFSEALAQSCRQAGIGLKHAVRTGGKACTYMAIHDRQGDMLAAVNDMAAIDNLTKECVFALPPDGFSACVLDANLPEEVLIAAAKHLRAPLIADPVSNGKADRLRPILARLTALKPNLLEARHLTGADYPEEAAQALRGTGVQQVYVSLGSRGLYAAAEGLNQYFPPAEPSNEPSTGAGDAMTAGIAFAIAAGLSPAQAAGMGIGSAANHLEHS